jgi:radical SAM family uncharacterized protein
LPRVSRPGQYVGLEINARCEDVERAEVSIVMAFPDAYSIGISHLGSQVLYQMLNDTPGAACDRTYCPMADTEAVMREEGVPLFGWESRCRVKDFDIVGFSLGYEICATNVLTMLDLAGIPLRAADRGKEDPIVVGGDAGADAPEPLADFFDVFLVGDGEEPLAAMVEVVRRGKRENTSREKLLLEIAATVPSAYVPRFYRPVYNGGVFAGLERLRDDIPAVIHRCHIKNMSDSPAIAAPLVPSSEAVHERVVIEIMRGCPNACRFCQAGAARLPVRVRSVEEILDAARRGIAATGFREISLLSLSTSDYPHLDELIDRLTAEFTPQKVSISLPSLRVDSQLRQLPKLTSGVRKGGLTIAAEAGSLRLRRAIHKDISDEDMIAGVRAAYAAGWQSVKVYFMAGLPGETPEDIDEIHRLCLRLSDARRQVDGRRGAINASVSWFVPKPHTPMQWCAMRDMEYFFGVRRRLRELSQRSPVSFRFHRIERSLLEGVLCRGDRRMGAVIESAWRSGARMDAWDEHFDFEKWAAAMRDAFPDMTCEQATPPGVLNEIPPDAPLPWGHIACYRSEKFLRDEYDKMLEELRK